MEFILQMQILEYILIGIVGLLSIFAIFKLLKKKTAVKFKMLQDRESKN